MMFFSRALSKYFRQRSMAQPPRKIDSYAYAPWRFSAGAHVHGWGVKLYSVQSNNCACELFYSCYCWRRSGWNNVQLCQQLVNSLSSIRRLRRSLRQTDLSLSIAVRTCSRRHQLHRYNHVAILLAFSTIRVSKRVGTCPYTCTVYTAIFTSTSVHLGLHETPAYSK